MDSDKKIDKTLVYYVLGGAAVGAVAGYIVKKVGFKNVLNVLKTKKIIPETLMETISEFTNKNQENDFDLEE
ncbi:MAG: hypothetical protein FJW68_01560 [Actinobacteria bacterium]|nr:hypothetical protein [Actinomycetota bacterium]